MSRESRWLLTLKHRGRRGELVVATLATRTSTTTVVKRALRELVTAGLFVHRIRQRGHLRTDRFTVGESPYIYARIVDDVKRGAHNAVVEWTERKRPHRKHWMPRKSL